MTYILLINIKKDSNLIVGRLGKVELKRGEYIYVGRVPPKMLYNRIKRHFLKRKSKFWHIDRVTSLSRAHIRNVWITEEEECKVSAQIVKNLKFLTIKKGFGSSDCKCMAHFFRIVDKRRIIHFIRRNGFLILS